MKRQLLAGAAFLLGATSAWDRADAKTEEDQEETPATIACAQERGDALGQCAYSIKRDENGKITMTVAFPNGFKRGLFFKDGQFLKGSVTMSGVGTDTDWGLKDGMHMIRVDDQRYDVPDSLIAGR